MRSDSFRLTLLFTVLSGAVLAIFSASLYYWVRDGRLRESERELNVQARMIHEYFLEEYDEVARGVHPSVQEAMEDFLSPTELAVEIRGSDGRLVCSKGRLPSTPEGWRVVALPFEARGVGFVLRAALSLQPMEAALRELRLFFAVFSPAALLVSCFLGMMFVRRALAPVEEIRRHAERISRANVSERVPEPSSTGEIQQLARTINEMMGRLESAIQDLDTFAADAAHELRTPLANLRAELETAIQQPLSPDESQRVLGSALEEVSRMSRIVADLFTLARVDLRQFAFRKERIALRPLLQDTIDAWGASASPRGITLALEGDDAEVAGDPVALNRIFMNLVENALKYNRDGGRVTLRITTLDDRVRVDVEDSGIGIPPEHLPRLFRRFYRVDEARSRERGGAGLGLAIGKSFVEAQGGTIAVRSAVGAGSTFSVELPRA